MAQNDAYVVDSCLAERLVRQSHFLSPSVVDCKTLRRMWLSDQNLD